MFSTKLLVVLLAALVVIGTASASGAGTVKNVSGKVWIDNVDRLQWGKGQDNSFISALTAAMRAIGEDVTYEYLMGVSGAAFRVQFLLPSGCPSSPDATCGFDCSVTAAKALGYPLNFIGTSEDKPDEVKKTRAEIVESIDKGNPVLAINLISEADWGVIIGYTNAGSDFLCWSYYDKSSRMSLAENWPWAVIIIGNKDKAPSRKASIIESFKTAQKVAETEKFGNYASGYSAFEAWIKHLQNEKEFKKLKASDLGKSTHTNAWCYNSLIDCRVAAVKYLRSIKGELSSSAAEHISKAADIYEQEVKLLAAGWDNAPYTWQLEEGKSWTEDMRKAEAETLKAAMELEKKAISEIKAALAEATKA